MVSQVAILLMSGHRWSSLVIHFGIVRWSPNSHCQDMQVGDDDRIGEGGGLVNDGEAIEVLALPMKRCQEFIADVHTPKSAGLVLGMLWLQARLNTQQASRT